jgi:hypothetical protein
MLSHVAVTRISEQGWRAGARESPAFDSSRFQQAKREVTSFRYPMWLAQAAAPVLTIAKDHDLMIVRQHDEL